VQELLDMKNREKVWEEDRTRLVKIVESSTARMKSGEAHDRSDPNSSITSNNNNIASLEPDLSYHFTPPPHSHHPYTSPRSPYEPPSSVIDTLLKQIDFLQQHWTQQSAEKVRTLIGQMQYYYEQERTGFMVQIHRLRLQVAQEQEHLERACLQWEHEKIEIQRQALRSLSESIMGIKEMYDEASKVSGDTPPSRDNDAVNGSGSSSDRGSGRKSGSGRNSRRESTEKANEPFVSTPL